MWPGKQARDDGFIALDACHRRILAVVATLEDLVEDLDREGPSAASSATAASIADFLSGEARAHHVHEESFVFPALVRFSDPAIDDAIERLHEDHDRIEEAWMELEPHVQAIATGYGSCDMDVLKDGVPQLAALFREHIALEESLIYPAARARLGAAERRSIGRRLAGRVQEQSRT